MLALDGIHAGYGEVSVLRDVDLVVPTGSVVALLGPNGAGKSTLLKVASGLLAPTAGSVTLDGVVLSGRSVHDVARRGICHVPEGRAVFRGLTVRENLKMQAAPGAEDVAVEHAAAFFPILGRRLDQLAGTLSGGEQQMLALARAAVTEPDVVLLDEVSMGLAPKAVDTIFDVLGRLAERGCALLLVEQYIDRALELAEYVYLLDRGRVSFAGEPAELSVDELHERYLGAS